MNRDHLPKTVEIDSKTFYCGPWHAEWEGGEGPLGAGLFESKEAADRDDPYDWTWPAESWGVITEEGHVWRHHLYMGTIEMPKGESA